MIKERPIPFSGDMIRAILGGWKTQTRRLRGLEEINKNPDDWSFTGFLLETGDARFVNRQTGEVRHAKNYFGQRGDRLWVRETWCNINKPQHKPEIYYRADATDKGIEDYDPSEWKWKPSIHMFRKYSRILLDRTDTRMERVQDISEEDAKAEGAEKMHLDDLGQTWKTYQRGFESLWDSLNGKKYPWKSNPFVWMIGFRRIL